MSDGKKPGRPRIQANTEQIEELAGIGCTVAEIAAVTGISKRTLETNFHANIENGRERANMSLRRAQMEKAKEGNVPMLIWLGKQRLGQRERTENINENRHEFNQADLDKISHETIAQIAKEFAD